jgi:hypothetical protein
MGRGGGFGGTPRRSARFPVRNLPVHQLHPGHGRGFFYGYGTGDVPQNARRRRKRQPTGPRAKRVIHYQTASEANHTARGSPRPLKRPAGAGGRNELARNTTPGGPGDDGARASPADARSGRVGDPTATSPPLLTASGRAAYEERKLPAGRSRTSKGETDCHGRDIGFDVGDCDDRRTGRPGHIPCRCSVPYAEATAGRNAW